MGPSFVMKIYEPILFVSSALTAGFSDKIAHFLFQNTTSPRFEEVGAQMLLMVGSIALACIGLSFASKVLKNRKFLETIKITIYSSQSAFELRLERQYSSDANVSRRVKMNFIDCLHSDSKLLTNEITALILDSSSKQEIIFTPLIDIEINQCLSNLEKYALFEVMSMAGINDCELVTNEHAPNEPQVN